MNLHQPINYRMYKDMTCMERKESSIADIHARTGNDDTSIKLLSSRYIRNMNKYPNEQCPSRRIYKRQKYELKKEVAKGTH